ncbi:MAG: preprotein translocase subunit SecG [Armatimonadetes bacterium]|jgi:preprotein translocase subunit SecG|nr:preprotein translocase subunit SecG [Armatimonadota bacterium]
MSTFLIVLQIVSALALIGIVMSQATKSEGLSGTIGGKAESAFQGKPGFEEKLSEITKWAAVFFIVTSALVAYLVK